MILYGSHPVKYPVVNRSINYTPFSCCSSDQVTCKPCEDGYFAIGTGPEESGATTCKPHQVCPVGSYADRPRTRKVQGTGTATHDVQCECAPGTVTTHYLDERSIKPL